MRFLFSILGLVPLGEAVVLHQSESQGHFLKQQNQKQHFPVRVPPLRSDVILTFVNDDEDGAKVPIAVQVPFSFSEFLQGLMYRPEIPENEGMLFSWNTDNRQRGFWMKDTWSDLDIIWVNSNLKVVSVKKALANTLNGVNTDAPARWVVEARPGWAEDHGIVAGRSRLLSAPPMTLIPSGAPKEESLEDTLNGNSDGGQSDKTGDQNDRNAQAFMKKSTTTMRIMFTASDEGVFGASREELEAAKAAGLWED